LTKKTSKKQILKTAVRVYLSAILFLITAGCTPDPFFVPVVSIYDVPETGTAGIPLTLTGTVSPAFASNSKIIWLIDDAGTTGAGLNGNILNTLTKGIVTIEAIIPNGIAEGKDYTQDFIIEIEEDLTAQAHAVITITFAQITDNAPVISVPSISISGAGGKNKQETITIDGTGYTDIKWEITGTGYTITGTGISFTLDATDVRYNIPGDHHLTLTLKKDGVPYNKTIIFTIVS